MTFWHTAVGNRIATVHGRITGHFNDSMARTSAYNNTDRMRTRIRPVLFILGSTSVLNLIKVRPLIEQRRSLAHNTTVIHKSEPFLSLSDLRYPHLIEWRIDYQNMCDFICLSWNEVE